MVNVSSPMSGWVSSNCPRLTCHSTQDSNSRREPSWHCLVHGPIYCVGWFILQFFNLLNFLFSLLCPSPRFLYCCNLNFPKCHQPMGEHTHKATLITIPMLLVLCLCPDKAGPQSPPQMCHLGLSWGPREVSREVTDGASPLQSLLMPSCRETSELAVSAVLWKCR